MANATGWIKVHRSIQDHWLFTERRVFSKYEAWMDILLTANHDDVKIVLGNSLIECKRGQSILSLESWGKRWSWSKSSVKRFFTLLEKDNMIKCENVLKTTRITICKYDTYQDSRNDIETPTKRKRNTFETQTKRDRNGSETRLEPNKNDKKDNNEKNDKNEEEVSFLSEPSSEEKKDLKDSSTDSEKFIQEEIPDKNDFKKFGKAEFRQILLDLEVDPQHVEDWIKVRTAKRAGFTATALQLIFNECTKHNFPIAKAIEMCAGKSWQGFKYEWYLNETGNGKQPANTTSQSRQQRVDEVAEFRRANQQSIIERLQKYTAGNNQ